jgi:hypothetical protein
MLEELEVLKDVAGKLNDARIPYMISGSVAMNFYAQPRMTRDIDIVIVLKENDVKRFVSLFENDFYIEEEAVKVEVARRGMFNFIHNQYIVKIDFILRKEGVFDDTAFERRRLIKIDSVEMPIISPEDLILYKLIWAGDSLSEMQIKDVRNILDMVEGLDVGYLSKWTDQLGLQQLFEKAKQ